MFNYLNGILYKSTKITDISESDPDFQPYIVQRWCTMHSSHLTHIVNETTNKYWQVLDSKTAWYRLLDTTIPRCSYKKITYFKKSKKEDSNNEKSNLLKIANNLEISSRELINYMENFNLAINTNKNNDQ